MSVTSHLKDLLTKMGGVPKTGDSTSVLIDKIEDVYDSGSGGGGSQPSGSGYLLVTIYADEARDIEGSVYGFEVDFKWDKTLREVMTAYANGIPITLVADSTRKYDISVFNNTGFDGQWMTFSFVPRVITGNNFDGKLAMADPDEGVQIITPEFAAQYEGGSDNFAYAAAQYTGLELNIEKELGDPYRCRLYNPGLFAFSSGFECETLDDYPIHTIQFDR